MKSPPRDTPTHLVPARVPDGVAVEVASLGPTESVTAAHGPPRRGAVQTAAEDK